jgi:hypothetical protein
VVGESVVRGGSTVKMSGFSSNLRNCRISIESISGASTTIAQSMVEIGFDITVSPSDKYTMLTNNAIVPADCISLRITVYTKFSAGVCSGQLDLSNVFLELL